MLLCLLSLTEKSENKGYSDNCNGYVLYIARFLEIAEWMGFFCYKFMCNLKAKISEQGSDDVCNEVVDVGCSVQGK